MLFVTDVMQHKANAWLSEFVGNMKWTRFTFEQLLCTSGETHNIFLMKYECLYYIEK
jgi:hypothetical protein